MLMAKSHIHIYRISAFHEYNKKAFNFNVVAPRKLLESTLKRKLLAYYDLSGATQIRVTYIGVENFPPLFITDSPYQIYRRKNV